MYPRVNRWIPFVLLAACSSSPPPPSGITAANLGVVVNAADPQSVAVAANYASARGIPAANVFTVSFPPDAGMDDGTFAGVKAQVDQAAGARIQALAITWTFPYLVANDAGCSMSITSAFAFGYDTQWCCDALNVGCATAASPYYDSASKAPFTDLGIRPSMMLAGASAADVASLVSRAVAADGTQPTGTAYLVETGDPQRSDRIPEYQTLEAGWDAGAERGVGLSIVDTSDAGDFGPLLGAKDVMFYFTGAFDVPGLTANDYRPGAIGDDDTSFEGIPNGQLQTNCLQWLQAGVVGTYGTVVEPGAETYKMSDVSVVIPRYLAGESLIEAYWKSVKYPGEGLFAGEPLVRPWK